MHVLRKPAAIDALHRESSGSGSPTAEQIEYERRNVSPSTTSLNVRYLPVLEAERGAHRRATAKSHAIASSVSIRVSTIGSFTNDFSAA
jgi:hypothetical protein